MGKKVGVFCNFEPPENPRRHHFSKNEDCYKTQFFKGYNMMGSRLWRHEVGVKVGGAVWKHPAVI